MKNDSNKVNAMHAYCKHLLANKNPERALLISDSAARIAKKTAFHAGELRSCDISRSIYFERNEFDKALEKDRRKLTKQLSLNDQAGIAAAQEAIGTDFAKLNKGDSALHYFKLSLANYKAAGDRVGFGQVSCSIGAIYLVKQDYGKAITFCKESLSIFEELKEKSHALEAYTLLHHIYSEIGNTPLANDYELKINRLSKELTSQ